MTEPIYEFVRGKGWIISTQTYTMSCGTVVRLEHRMPRLGEPWLWSHTWIQSDGTPEWISFKKCLRLWTSYDSLFNERCRELPDDEHGAMTIIPA